MFQEQIPTQEGHQLIQDLFSSNSAEQVLRQSVKVSCSSSILFGHWVIVYVKMGRTRSINSVSARTDMGCIHWKLSLIRAWQE